MPAGEVGKHRRATGPQSDGLHSAIAGVDGKRCGVRNGVHRVRVALKGLQARPSDGCACVEGGQGHNPVSKSSAATDSGHVDRQATRAAVVRSDLPDHLIGYVGSAGQHNGLANCVRLACLYRHRFAARADGSAGGAGGTGAGRIQGR